MVCGECFHSFDCFHRINCKTGKDSEIWENIFWLLFIWVFTTGFRRRPVGVRGRFQIPDWIPDWHLAGKPLSKPLELCLRFLLCSPSPVSQASLPWPWPDTVRVRKAEPCYPKCGPCTGPGTRVSRAQVPLPRTADSESAFQ